MEWEDLRDNPRYHPVQDAIQAGLDIMWNSVNPVLDPTRKCMYLDVAWDEEWVLAAKDHMHDIVSI